MQSWALESISAERHLRTKRDGGLERSTGRVWAGHCVKHSKLVSTLICIVSHSTRGFNLNIPTVNGRSPHRPQGVFDVGFDAPLSEKPLELKLEGEQQEHIKRRARLVQRQNDEFPAHCAHDGPLRRLFPLDRDAF